MFCVVFFNHESWLLATPWGHETCLLWPPREPLLTLVFRLDNMVESFYIQKYQWTELDIRMKTSLWVGVGHTIENACKRHAVGLFADLGRRCLGLASRIGIFPKKAGDYEKSVINQLQVILLSSGWRTWQLWFICWWHLWGSQRAAALWCLRRMVFWTCWVCCSKIT